MSEPELVTHDAQNPAPNASPSTTNHVGASPPGGPRDAAKVDDSVVYTDPPAYFIDALDDAERLLKYSAEMGIEVDDNTRNSVLEARAAVTAGWSERIAANLLAALAKLAALLKPVTAESLRSYNTRPTVRTYWMVAICLAIFTVPFSVASFVASAISKSITADIATANDLAVKLTAQFQPFGAQAMPTTQGETTAGVTTPAPSGSAAKTITPLPAGLSPTDAVTELQTFASQIRAIYARSRQLDYLILHAVKDPFTDLRGPGEFKRTFQLPVPLPPDLATVVSGRVLVYQDARSFGQDVVDDVSVFYGATTTCILPVLYALLGTCAYLLRSFSQEMSSRTFVPSHSDSARFLIAAIVGGVVGLFNNFTVSQAVSIPPLAIAFVVGYAVDVFFSFLEGLIQAFSKARNGSGGAQRQLSSNHKS